ncbi:MAG TPA: hypothetical protein VK162_14285 [Streptosporangiaceae bacterium]|nr:hypothetical protein [Streptosporangiaceae bacterium]
MISGRTNTVVATVRVGRAPVGVAVNPRTNAVYVANEIDNTVSVISGRTNTVVATVRNVATPVGVAVNPRTNTIYIHREPAGWSGTAICNLRASARRRRRVRSRRPAPLSGAAPQPCDLGGATHFA